MINALAIVKGDAAYKHIIDLINQLVTESRNVIVRRLAHKKIAAIGKDSAETPDIPAPPAVKE